jgi:hypothetical protein
VFVHNSYAEVRLMKAANSLLPGLLSVALSHWKMTTKFLRGGTVDELYRAKRIDSSVNNSYAEVRTSTMSITLNSCFSLVGRLMEPL